MGLIHDLPLAPDGKSGWPWTHESQDFSELIDDGRDWPRISIITPSYNQGRFLEETIRTVLLQNYPNLEYIVMDGGSTDQYVEIIQIYEEWIDCWQSEPDGGGQSAAINAGIWRLEDTDIINWINSDDSLMPGTVLKISQEYLQHCSCVAWACKSEAIYADDQVFMTAIPRNGKKSDFAN